MGSFTPLSVAEVRRVATRSTRGTAGSQPTNPTTLVDELKGSRLHGVLTGLWNSAAPYIGLALRTPENQLEDTREHRMLLEALQSGDAEAAAAGAANHSALTIEVLERSRGLFDH